MQKEVIVHAHQELSYTISAFEDRATSYTFRVQESARLYVDLALFDASGEVHLKFLLEGPNSFAQCIGKFVSSSQFSLNVNQYHTAVGSKSSCLIKGIAQAQASVQVFGKVSIADKAPLVDASFTHKNLVFDTASVISEPMMEVSTHEVACNHGSAISRIDETMLLYCQSRGLSPEAARQLIINGFLSC